MEIIESLIGNDMIIKKEQRKYQPNKCAYCGLNVRYEFNCKNEVQNNDKLFVEIRQLYEDKIIPQRFQRSLEMSNDQKDFGITEFCAVASKAWNKNKVKCKYWQMSFQGASIADYLSIYYNRRAKRENYWLGVWAIMATLVAGVFGGILGFIL